MASGQSIGLDDILECPVCYETENTPKILECGHFVCEKCLVNMASLDELKRKYRAVCPKCRQETVLPSAGADNLVTNFAVIQLRNIICGLKGCRKCEMCEQKNSEAFQFCEDCRQYLCHACAAGHLKAHFYATHCLVSLCADHNKPYTFVCIQCPKLLCQLCIQKQICNDHDISRVKDIKEQKEKDMKEFIDKVSSDLFKNAHQHKPKIDFVHGLIGETKQVKEKVVSHAEKLHKRISKNADDILMRLDSWEKALQTTKEKLQHEDQHEHLSKLYEKAKKAQSDGIENIVLQLPKLLEALPPPAGDPQTEDIVPYPSFEPDESLDLGQLSVEAVILNNKPHMLWSSTILRGGKDAAFTPCGHVAVTDCFQNKVFLYNTHGDIVADSETKGVLLRLPFGIASHPQKAVLLVAEMEASELAVLSAKDLTLQTRYHLPETTWPTGVGVLSDGRIVVANCYPGKITVYQESDKELEAQVSWNLYYFPFCVDVDTHDNIIVHDKNEFLMYNSNGDLKSVIEIPNSTLLQQCTESVVGMLAVTDSERIVRCGDAGDADDEDDGNQRDVITWTPREEQKYGGMRSITVQGHRLVVVLKQGICCYLIGP